MLRLQKEAPWIIIPSSFYSFSSSILPYITSTIMLSHMNVGRVCLKHDGTHAETRFHLSPKRTSPFKSARASVQLTAGSRGVRIIGSNAGYAMFRGSVRVLATHSIRHFPLTSPPVRQHVPSGFKRTVLLISMLMADN